MPPNSGDEQSSILFVVATVAGLFGLSQWLPKVAPKYFSGWIKAQADKQEHEQSIQIRLLNQLIEQSDLDNELKLVTTRLESLEGKLSRLIQTNIMLFECCSEDPDKSWGEKIMRVHELD